MRELICVLDKKSVCAIEHEGRMAAYPNRRQVAKRVVTENADFEHHYLAAVTAIPIAGEEPAIIREPDEC